MQVIAVPVKPLERSKRRLASILSPLERAALTLAMLEDVLAASLAVPGWDVWVISSSSEALAAAARLGARPVRDRGRSLRASVRQVEGAVAGPRSRLAVLLADLPLLSGPALAWALSHRGKVLASPAHSDGGTNLLVRRPSTIIPARFGRSSYRSHQAEAYRRGLTLQEVAHPQLAFDLDRPADLVRVLEAGRRGRTHAVCRELGLAARLGVPA